MNTHRNDLTGRSLVGIEESTRTTHAEGRTFTATDPATGEKLGPVYTAATDAELEHAGRLAAEAFGAYASSPGPDRTRFMHAIADELERDSEAIVERGRRETALSEGRLNGELGRTTNQIRMFAELVEDEAWRDPRAQLTGEGSAWSADLRSMRRAIGPVAVFGAGNFPLAFSVAGGDTASALAAGCPVIAKAHPGHPGLSELAGHAIARAARATRMPLGVFSLLFDDAHDVGVELVKRPEVRAVAFTGSRSGGQALMQVAAERDAPIPVFAEMGSINPLFVLPEAAKARGEEIAEGLHGSFTLGVGQFCTKPGVVLVPRGAAGDALVRALAERTEGTTDSTMLNTRTSDGYERGLVRLRDADAELVASGAIASSSPACGAATLWETDLDKVAARPALLEEVFGPSTVVLRYDLASSLAPFVRALEGQLTGTIHAERDELAAHRDLIESIADRAGRVIVNQFPTGVDVGPATVHGGPYPATSDGRSTSVGSRAIERFTRWVSYQNVPPEVLPEPLQNLD